MMSQQDISEHIQCGVCGKSEKITFLPNEQYGMAWGKDKHPHDEAVFSMPIGWFMQFDGDYCGGRWMYIFCSAECAKRK